VLDVLDERRFRDIAKKLGRIVDYRLRDTANHITLSEISKFIDLHNVSDDPRIRYSHLVRQPGDTRAVRSRRRDEDLKMEIRFKTVQDLDRVLCEINLCFRNIDQTS
jgi:hypothetical protein